MINLSKCLAPEAGVILHVARLPKFTLHTVKRLQIFLVRSHAHRQSNLDWTFHIRNTGPHVTEIGAIMREPLGQRLMAVDDVDLPNCGPSIQWRPLLGTRAPTNHVPKRCYAPEGVPKPPSNIMKLVRLAAAPCVVHLSVSKAQPPTSVVYYFLSRITGPQPADQEINLQTNAGVVANVTQRTIRSL